MHRADDAKWWSSLTVPATQEVALVFTSLEIRVVEQMPATVAVRPPGGSRAFPVATLDEVERGDPVPAEVLARWRQRRDASSAAPGAAT